MRRLILPVIFISFLTIICRSERSECYRQNKFDVYPDSSCESAAAFYYSAESIRSGLSSSISADTNQRIGDVFLLQCLDNSNKLQKCDKKSDITPHVW